MGTTLYAGAARRAINPQLGTGMAGLRLFGSPIQAIESDLTATALVLGDGDTKVAVIAIDLCVMSMAEGGRLRAAVAEALGTPVSHVLLNLSHVHSSPALPEFMAMTDSAEDVRVPDAIRARPAALARRGRGGGGRPPAAGADRQRLGRELDRRLPARDPRRPRRARRGARPPDRPVRRRHPRRRPRRQPDRRRLPLLRAPRHGREPVAGRLARLPRPGAGRARAQPRRARPLPPRLRRQHQPARRDRLRGRLPRHQKPRRPRARRRGAQGRGGHPHQHPRRRAPTARQRPEHPLHALGARRRRHLHAPRGRRNDRPARVRRAALAGEGREILAHWQRTREERLGRRRPRLGDPRGPEVRALGHEARRPPSRTGTRRTTSTSRRSA